MVMGGINWESMILAWTLTSPNPRLSPKEYVEWITDAKREDTRAKRLATALQWLAEGKVSNWKYVKK